MNTEKLSPQQTSEAIYIKAKSLYETKRYDDAMIEFKVIAKNSKNASGAEAYYHIALIHFNKQDYKEVEKTVNKLVGYEYSNDDWNNKAMLLLADSYLAKQEDADAKVILESIIDGKPKQEYMDEAKKRLDALNLKQQTSQEKTKEGNKEMNIEFKQSANDKGMLDEMNKESQNPLKVPTNTVIEQPK